MKKILIATQNKGKIEEFKSIFKELNIEVISLSDIDDTIDIIEDGTTFEENALIKATYLNKLLNIPVISDDSGLEVEALDNKPGIYSARYAGEQKSDIDNNYKLLEELKEHTNKNAKFVCVIAYVSNSITKTFRGELKGEIINEFRGENGFGYDPIFYIKELDKTLAQLDRSTKNTISHRKLAIEKFIKELHNESISI